MTNGWRELVCNRCGARAINGRMDRYAQAVPLPFLSNPRRTPVSCRDFQRTRARLALGWHVAVACSLVVVTGCTRDTGEAERAAIDTASVERQQASGGDELARTTERLLQRLRDDSDDEDAAGALAALADAALPALRGGLADPDAEFRLAVVQILRAIPGDDSLALLRGALADVDEDVRFAVAEGLGERADRNAVALLRERYDVDDDAQVRYEILTALGSIGDPSVVPFLVERSADEDPYTRLWAVDALCQMRAPEAVDVATRLLGDDSPHVRRRVVGACGESLVRDDAIAGLIHIAVHADTFAESVAARRNLQALVAGRQDGDLAQRIRTVAVPALQSDAAVQAALLLADLNDPSGLDVLRDRYADPDPFTRHHIAFELGRLGGPKSIPPLIALLDDPVELVAATAHDALLNFAERGEQQAVDAVANYRGKTFPARLKDLATAQGVEY